MKEKTEKSIPAEYWANKELYNKDTLDGVPAKERMRRLKAGRYCIPEEIFEAYPTPHRDVKSNKIILENEVLYREDISEHGAYQARQWVEQGKYNLNKEEYEINTLRIKRKYGQLSPDEERLYQQKKIDWRNTEAVRQWKKARAAESKYH